MNEEEFERQFIKIIIKRFYDVFNDIFGERIRDAVEIVETECVCANYKQKCRSKLFETLTGKKQTFKYSGS